MNKDQKHVDEYMKQWLADQNDQSLDQAWLQLKQTVLDSLGDRNGKEE